MRESLALPIKLTIMMLIAALFLGATNLITEPRIVEQNKKQAEILRIEVLPQAKTFQAIEVQNAPHTLLAAFQGLDGDTTKGFVFEMNASGFGGSMGIAVGIGMDGTLQGVRLGSHQETPGLGAKATLPLFYDQYAGKEATALKVVKSKASGQEIQAITAATITTDAITLAVNDAIACFQTLKQQGVGQ